MELFPLNVDDLIHSRSVESLRIEYKTGYTETTKWAIVGTISAFANDLQNQNGGFVILGIEANNGVPVLPPAGLNPHDLETIQQGIRVGCKKIDPEYQPVFFPVQYEGKQILIVWAPAGDNRPYKAPDDRNPSNKCYHVRHGAETVKATGGLERQLLELTARIPFDDRRAHDATIVDISPILVKRFLTEIRSDLMSITPSPSDPDLYKALGIVAENHSVMLPRNIGLLFFNERPERFFRGCAFEVVQFSDDAGGNFIEEKKFSGPLDSQIIAVVEYLDSLTNVQIRKIPGIAQVERTIAYPYEALEEAVANAAYHRSYESSVEPNKIHLYPNRLEIISYPGPVAGITLEQLRSMSPVPPVPARNRRIGEFLKELRLVEMRGTGIPKIRRAMSQNGSADPIIDFDPDRTYFRVILPAHPRYQALHSLRESAYLWSIGEKKSAIERLQSVADQNPGSGAVVAQLIDFHAQLGNLPVAESIFRLFHKTPLKYEIAQPYLKFFKIMFDNNDRARAKEAIDLLPENEYSNSSLEVAIAYKRLKVFDKAHTILSKIFVTGQNDEDYLHNFAKVKISIASAMAHRHNPQWLTIRRIRLEAVELLRRYLSLSKNDTQKAWGYFDLARTLAWLKVPSSQIKDAFENAIALLPYEAAFREAYEKWRKYNLRGIDMKEMDE